TGGVFIKSMNGWIRGTAGKAELVPQTYKPKLITIEGDVTGESKPAGASDAWKVRAAWIEAAISSSGNAERVKTKGNVELQQNAEDIATFGTQRRAERVTSDRRSSADRTNARFDGHTNMLLELVQTGNFQFRDPQYQGHANTARFETDRTIGTTDGSPAETEA